MSLNSKIVLVSIAAFLTFMTPTIVLAGDTAVPPSTNPANHAIFPAKGQDADQQMKDQLAAYNWATRQTGWDPYKAHDKLVSQGHAAEQTAEQAKGGLLGGAARGKGAAIGATAGGLTGGMRSRRTQREAQSATDQAIDTFNRQFANWDKNYVAAMEGHGYTVK